MLKTLDTQEKPPPAETPTLSAAPIVEIDPLGVTAEIAKKVVGEVEETDEERDEDDEEKIDFDYSDDGDDYDDDDQDDQGGAGTAATSSKAVSGAHPSQAGESEPSS